MNVIVNAITAAILPSFLASYITKGQMNSVWGMIHSLEIVASFFLLTLRMPLNAGALYEIIYNIAGFSLVADYYVEWYDSIFAEEETDEDEDEGEDVKS